MDLKSRLAAQRDKNDRPDPLMKGLLREHRLTTPTKIVYHDTRRDWESFKQAFGEPDPPADLATLKVFFWWDTSNTKGRIGERPTLDTVIFKVQKLAHVFKRYHNQMIATEILGEVRRYIRDELVDELGLVNERYPREFTDWADIKMAIRYLLAKDEHRYNHERSRIQMGLIFLLIADDGERLGAIASSSSYRKENISLRYQDVRVYLRPASTRDASPEVKVEIRYDNKKFERNDPNVFLALAFLDEAFQGCSTPAELFSKRNTTGTDILIPFKVSKMEVLIFRKWDVHANRLSDTQAWSAGSVTNQGQRILRDLGCNTHFTFYATRRGVSNSIADSNVPAGRRKQLMGHSSTSDTVFRNHYQSKRFPIDTGNIFRGEEQRKDKREMLSMRLKWDPNGPKRLSDDRRRKIWAADTELQDIDKDIEAITRELEGLGGDPDRGYDRVSLQASKEAAFRRRGRRRSYLKDQGLKSLRKEFFETRDGSVFESLPSWEDSSTGEEIEGEDEPEYRAELVEASYSSSGIAGAALAIEKLVAHCSNIRDTSKEISHQNVERAKKGRPRGPLKQSNIAQATLTDSLPALTPETLNQSSDISPRIPLAPQPPETGPQQWGEKSESSSPQDPQSLRESQAEVQQLLLTPEEVQKLINLRAGRLPWKTVAEKFPGYSISTLKNIHKLERACGILPNEKPNRKPKELIATQTEPPFTPQEVQKLINMRAAKQSWISIAKIFPG